jgi:hypothetical protein
MQRALGNALEWMNHERVKAHALKAGRESVVMYEMYFENGIKETFSIRFSTNAPSNSGLNAQIQSAPSRFVASCKFDIAPKARAQIP